MTDLITKSIRVNKDENELLKAASEYFYLPESSLVKSWIKEKLAEFKLRRAVDTYKKSDTVSLGKAAEMAGVSTREMMDVLEKEGVSWLPKP